MKKITRSRSFLYAAILCFASLGMTSCDDDTVEPEVEAAVRGAYDQKGVFILNEGNYGTPNGSISFLSDSAGHTAIYNIFSKANASRPLGDVVTDLDLVGDRAYITVNNSNKVEVVNAYTFKAEAVLENLKQPRYFTALNEDKAYVSEWIRYGEPGQVSVIDLKTMKVSKTIPVGPQPEELLVVGDKLYVAVSGADVIAVINTATDTRLADIQVTDGPFELEADRHNNLWVLSAGVKYTEANTAAALSMIETANGTVSRTLPFSDPEAFADNLTLSGSKDRLYFTYNGNTYAQSITATALPTTALINRSFYSLGVHPETGQIYGGDSNNFSGDGTVQVYTPEGSEVSSIKAGIGPNGFVFR
ncbi:DUF5074 domain-containing protein [Pontibacter anaerobius]|uniref:YVTN family beta-propeller protein n=1 Tax=Pontibacter anaerobius TaxID=2993940 RepID=A0ABT3R9R0_9BACT|nr:DUF5074 domain-containing protein [Pontibacter anaerobius]MCX2738455.1 hypothetical protein [Pontibacter anaerobius]